MDVEHKFDEPSEDESTKSSSDNSESENDNEDTELDKETIRSELKSMSFAELLNLKNELGSKVYNEAIFGAEAKAAQKNKRKRGFEFKRENKNRPREISAKKQVPLLGKVNNKSKEGPRDPRFDSYCGEFDRDKFKKDYEFVNEIREKEIAKLKQELRQLRPGQAEEKQKIKLLLQRMLNQNTEEKKLKERKERKLSMQQKNKQAITGEKKPFFMSKGEQKAMDLVKQFEELKKTGKLNKHLEKRRKKNISRDRKRYDS